VLRTFAYIWAFPVTAIGLLVALLTVITGGRARVVRGVLEADGGAAAWLLRHCTPLKGGAAAMTLGHVVIARDRQMQERCRDHERIHVRQVERWGVLFLPAYFIASAVAMARGKHFYRDNRFEREAFERVH
jgi:hypothetical protein